jgi:hypothetical protein
LVVRFGSSFLVLRKVSRNTALLAYEQLLAGILLGFAPLMPADIREGIRRLAGALK